MVSQETDRPSTSNLSDVTALLPCKSLKRKKCLPSMPTVPPHPLGIKPLGNRLFEQTQAGFVDTRSRGLGYFALFSDEFLLAWIVQYLDDPRLLCRLSETSKAWYAFWQYQEIWKGWVLERWRKASSSDAKRFIPSGWRQTYAYLTANATLPDSPSMQIPHFYSDLLFQPHLYASVPLSYLTDMLESYSDSGFLRTMDCISQPPVHVFRDLYEKPGYPCILKECMDSWPALQGWTWNKLATQFGSILLRAEAIDITLKDYLHYMLHHPGDECLIYLFDKDYPKQGKLGQELARGFQVPPYFTEDLFSVLGSDRPDYNWLIVGPARSGSSHHKDPNATSAWNAVISGAKLWIMYPPDVVPPGVFPSEDGGEVSTPVSLIDWWLNWFPQTKNLVKSLPKEKKPIWGICRAGEVVFVPSGWWHTVINLEDSVAITQNYVSKANLALVLEFLFNNRSMISGYGNADDCANVVGQSVTESQKPGQVPSARGVQAEKLYENFVEALKRQFHDDVDLMQIVTDFEASTTPRETKPSFWETITQNDATSFSLFG